MFFIHFYHYIVFFDIKKRGLIPSSQYVIIDAIVPARV